MLFFRKGKQWTCSWVEGDGGRGKTGAALVQTPHLLFPGPGGPGTNLDAGAFLGDVLELPDLELRGAGEGVLVHGLG